MPYTVTKNEQTFEQLETQINALAFRDVWPSVMARLYPSSAVENNSTGVEPGETLYDMLRPYQLSGNTRIYDTKLPYSPAVVDEVTDYKADLVTALTAEFDELQRVKDITDRVDALHNWRQAAINLGQYDTYVNVALFAKAIADADDTAFLALLEAEDASIQAELVFQSGVDEKESRMRLGTRIIAVINKLNEDSNITAEQLTAIFSNATIQQIMQALQTGSLLTAQALITPLDLTGLAPMDQSYKDRINSMINDYLGV